MCHNFRDPFQYRVVGYREEEIVDGKVIDPENPESLRCFEPEVEAEIQKLDDQPSDTQQDMVVGEEIGVLPSMGSLTLSTQLEEEIPITDVVAAAPVTEVADDALTAWYVLFLWNT